jgi:predicted site-specific integrase-resolvase
MKKGTPKYLSTVEVARLLEVSTFSIQQWFDRGLFEGPTLPGGKRRITMESFLAFVKKHDYSIDPAEIPAARD